MINDNVTRTGPNWKEKADRIINKAIAAFNRDDIYLLENDLNERCMCSRLAYHIARILDEDVECKSRQYIADVEYNRGLEGNEKAIKRLKDDIIVLDLIVHKRKYETEEGFDNFICIEMKKSNDQRGEKGIADDEDRLKMLTDLSYGFNYKAGYMIIADVESKKLSIKIHPGPFYLQ